jgi:hypothetical protein
MQGLALTAIIAPPLGYVMLSVTWWALLTLPALIALWRGLGEAIQIGDRRILWFFLPLGLSHLSFPLAAALGPLPAARWLAFGPALALCTIAIGLFIWLARKTLRPALLIAVFCVAYALAGTIGYGMITI